MCRSFVVSLTALFFLAGCNNTKKPSNANFTKAINQYLVKHGDTCSSLGQMLPIDVTVPGQKEQYGIGPQLAALEEAGLVHSTNTTAVVRGMLGALRGSTPPQPVRRYELTDQGKKVLSANSSYVRTGRHLLLWPEDGRFDHQVDGAHDDGGGLSK